MAYWLMKSEPDTFSIDDLKARPDQTEPWDGVRNYQARNMMRDQMQVGDQAFFYHSNCEQPGIVGIMTIVRAGYPDTSALDPDSPYHDPRASLDNPRWFRVDVRFQSKFRHTVTLNEMKQHPQLAGMAVLARGNRLSITPVSAAHWDVVLSLA